MSYSRLRKTLIKLIDKNLVQVLKQDNRLVEQTSWTFFSKYGTRDKGETQTKNGNLTSS